MFPYRAVIFDIDGTLFDSEEGVLTSIRYSASALGYTCPPDEVLRSVIGPPLRDSFTNIIHMKDSDLEKAVTLYKEHFRNVGIRRYRVYPGIRRLLRTLRANGIYTAVATSKEQAIADYNMRLYHLEALFDKVVGETEAVAKIGKAELIRRALPDMPLQDCVMVGDRCFDVQGAAEAGIDCIAVGYGYGTPRELRGAKHKVESIEELHELLCGSEKTEKGFFLSLEGPDGSGKTTQLHRLQGWLEQLDYDLHLTREPGGSPIGEKIRKLVLEVENKEMCSECEALLYAASRAQHVREIIRPMVKAGKLVLCDRFIDSSIAYQGGGRDLGAEPVRAINELAVDGFLPDATVYLSIDAEKALGRRLAATEPDRLESEGLAFQKKVQHAYEEQLKRYPERFLTVDASLSADEVTEQIHQRLLERLPE